MKRKRGICLECDNGVEVNLARVNPPQCLRHYKKQKTNEYKERAKTKQKANPVKKKGYSYKPTATGEGDLFRRIWFGELQHPDVCSENDSAELLRTSSVSGKSLGNIARTWFFSHLIKKSKEEQGRLDPENIRLMTWEEHQLWEYQQYKILADPILYKKWKHIFELKEYLLKKYESNEFN